jgi:hypothetical protein
MMDNKKNIQKLIIHSLKYIMNENKNIDPDLLNNYNKFNMKMLKISELKLYINNKLISKFCFYSHHVYKKIFDINFKPIKTLELLNLDDIYIEYYNSINGYNFDKNCVKIYIYSNLYLQTKKKTILESNYKSIKIYDSYISNNEPSTVLNEEELNIMEWLKI